MKTGAEYARTYRLRHPDRAKESDKKNRLKFAEKRRADFKRWREEHAEQCRAKCREWYQKNKARVAARHKAAYDANPDKYRKAALEFAKKFPEPNRRNQKVRRGLSKATPIERRKILAWLKNLRNKCFVSCSYCRVFMDPRTGHIDHIVPLRRGGTHSLSNLCFSCPACNMSKGVKLLSEWKPQYS